MLEIAQGVAVTACASFYQPHSSTYDLLLLRGYLFGVFIVCVLFVCFVVCVKDCSSRLYHLWRCSCQDVVLVTLLSENDTDSRIAAFGMSSEGRISFLGHVTTKGAPLAVTSAGDDLAIVAATDVLCLLHVSDTGVRLLSESKQNTSEPPRRTFDLFLVSFFIFVLRSDNAVLFLSVSCVVVRLLTLCPLCVNVISRLLCRCVVLR